jgi:hypothetical protein
MQQRAACLVVSCLKVPSANWARMQVQMQQLLERQHPGLSPQAHPQCLVGVWQQVVRGQRR